MGVPVTLIDPLGREVSRAVTDRNGRVAELASGLEPGRYRIEWDLVGTESGAFVQVVCLVIELREQRHYHVPLLATAASAVAYLGA